LLHRRFADEEGAGDLPDRQPRHDPEGQSDLLGRRQVGMAADEQEPQNVVPIVVPVQPVHSLFLHVLQIGNLVLRRKLLVTGQLAYGIEGGVAAHEDQPGGRIARRAVLRPGLEGAKASLLEGLLGQI
jgi:hypothetical protein